MYSEKYEDRDVLRHSHGDPEVARWRKKKKKINRAHCEHHWTEWTEFRSVWPRRNRQERPDGFSTETETVQINASRRCLKCNRRETKWRYERLTRHFHWDREIFRNSEKTDWTTHW